MKTIWKYQLTFNDLNEIEIPKGGKVLSFGNQFDVGCLWAMVDPEAEKEKRRFRIFGTGHPIEISVNLDYIGTAQFDGGNLIFHLFEEKF